MAGRKGFENFDPIFGEAEVEFGESFSELFGRRPFLFYVHALDPSRLEIVASNFHSHTFARVLTVHQLDDLRDDIGIGGSWSEFADYLIASLSSGTVKLVKDDASGGVNAKLIAHKSKGLPRISLSLKKLVNSSADDTTANFSLAIFKAFKDKQNDVIKERESLLQAKELLSSEKERSESLQKQLDSLSFLSKRKVHKSKASDKKISLGTDNATDNSTPLVSATQLSSVSETQAPTANDPGDHNGPSGKDTTPTKVNQKAVPASRRAKTRGVSLKDTGDEDC